MVPIDPREPGQRVGPFAIKDCALLALATGKKARLLQEFRTALEDVEAAAIYHHFWGGLLLPRFEEREYHNDFASWIRHGIHDVVLAERLSALAPNRSPDLEALRREVMELIDARVDEFDELLWRRPTQQFEFVRSQIVVFDTERYLRRPEELASAMKTFSISSVFYHFIDARRRTRDGRDDFSDWLGAFGDGFAPLRDHLAGVDPYFGSLRDLRDELSRIFERHFSEGSR